jgi:hypothetical protein
VEPDVRHQARPASTANSARLRTSEQKAEPWIPSREGDLRAMSIQSGPRNGAAPTRPSPSRSCRQPLPSTRAPLADLAVVARIPATEALSGPLLPQQSESGCETTSRRCAAASGSCRTNRSSRWTLAGPDPPTSDPLPTIADSSRAAGPAE